MKANLTNCQCTQCTSTVEVSTAASTIDLTELAF